MSTRLNHRMSFILYTLLLCLLLSLYQPKELDAAGTSNVTLAPSTATVGYSSPITVHATSGSSAILSGDMTTLLQKAGNTVAALPIKQAGPGNSLTFIIPPGISAGSYEIVFIKPGTSEYRSPFVIIEPSVRLLENNTFFDRTSFGYTSKTISVVGTDTDFLSDTIITLTKSGSASTYLDKITNVSFQNPTQFTFTLGSGLSAGDYNIRITNKGYASDHRFTVAAASYNGISVSAPKSELSVGEQMQLQVIAQTDAGSLNITDSPSVTYESSDPSIVSVTRSGIAQALKSAPSGQSITLTAKLTTDGSTWSSSILLKIVTAIVSIDIMPNPIVLNVNTNLPLKALAAYEDGSSADITRDVIWTTGNPNIASVDTVGKISGKGIGSSSVTASKGQLSVTKTLSVVPTDVLTVPSKSTQLDPTEPGLPSLAVPSSGMPSTSLLDTARQPAVETVSNSTALPVQSKTIGNEVQLTVSQVEALNSIRKSPNTVFNVPIQGNFSGISVNLTSDIFKALQEKGSGAALKVTSNQVEFTIPANALQFEETRALLGVDAAKQLDMRIVIQPAESLITAKLQDDALKAHSKIMVNPVDFRIEVMSGDKTISIHNFNHSFVTRSFNVPSPQVNWDKATAALYMPESRTFRHVPTKFVLTEQGTSKANFKRNGNSVYTLLETPVSFQDVTDLYWAKSPIDLMASKLILKGVDDNTFNPEGPVTRAQFAAIITRALGITPASPSGQFSDVPEEAWYTGEVQAAYDAEIVSGRSDHTFDPNAPILRQEMAIMIVNAMKFAGKPTNSDPSSIELRLSKFEDNNDISGYARPSVAYAVNQGLITGITDHTFEAAGLATRAQASVIALRMLRALDFIN